MKSEDMQALVSYRTELPREAIRAAEIMLKNEMLAFSMNRVYYSMFYSVQALLIGRGVSFSKHSQIKGYFNRELIKSGALPVEMGKLYNKAFEYRQKFDYVDFAVPEREMVVEYIDKARWFCAEIDKYIKNRLPK